MINRPPRWICDGAGDLRWQSYFDLLVLDKPQPLHAISYFFLCVSSNCHFPSRILDTIAPGTFFTCCPTASIVSDVVLFVNNSLGTLSFLVVFLIHCPERFHLILSCTRAMAVNFSSPWLMGTSRSLKGSGLSKLAPGRDLLEIFLTHWQLYTMLVFFGC